MKNLKNNLKKNKKGFTLVEIIVVLVILAVLAAASIPTMIGFVEDAKGKSEIANARAAYVAAQSVVTEETATGDATKAGSETIALKTLYTIGTGTPESKLATKFEKMVGKDLNGAKVTITDTATADGKIDKLVYVAASGYTVTINVGGETIVAKTA
ncbi:prepilin-type N-terminal cleavage/methylation domain-containing protein [Proteocatella sphenisci]|uniref:prepilin-type N-terminal cleavage/methylation domain-containing protein n=1 Tax=Proteocatella sphenisci TaxID=181070 RepID=UPI00048D2071|nr:prepilin-type N-terminal cleavage/methylation domain-containing protein [Proteocatella sphenisci]